MHAPHQRSLRPKPPRSYRIYVRSPWFLALELASADCAALQRPLDQGGALAVLRQILDAELLEQGAHVGLDRVDAELQLGGDRLVGRRRGEGRFVLEGAAEGEQDPALTG